VSCAARPNPRQWSRRVAPRSPWHRKGRIEPGAPRLVFALILLEPCRYRWSARRGAGACILTNPGRLLSWVGRLPKRASRRPPSPGGRDVGATRTPNGSCNLAEAADSACGIGLRTSQVHFSPRGKVTRSSVSFVSSLRRQLRLSRPGYDRERRVVCYPCVTEFLFDPSYVTDFCCQIMVPWSGIEPPTPSLPRTCSAPELPRLAYIAATYEKRFRCFHPRRGHLSKFTLPVRLQLVYG
jgi:hypothetical protein